MYKSNHEWDFRLIEIRQNKIKYNYFGGVFVKIAVKELRRSKSNLIVTPKWLFTKRR